MKALTQVLQQYRKDFLLEMAQALGIEDPPSRKVQLTQLLAEEIVHRAEAGELTRELNEAQQALLGLLLQHGGEMDYVEVVWRLSLLGFTPPPDQAPCPAVPSASSIQALLQPLLLVGIVVVSEIELGIHPPTFTGLERGMHTEPPRRIGIAPEVLAALRRREITFSPPPLGIERWFRPPPAPTLPCRDPYPFLRGMYLLWEELRHHSLRCTAKGTLTKHEVRRLLKRLSLLGDERWLEETFGLLKELGLVEVRDRYALTTDEAEAFWKVSATEALSAFFHRFRHDPAPYTHLVSEVEDEVRYEFDIQISPRSSLQLRRSLLKALSYIPAGQWVELSLLHCLLSQGRAGGFLYGPEKPERFISPDWMKSYYGARLAAMLKARERAILHHLLQVLSEMGMIRLLQTGEERWLITPCERFHAAMQRALPTQAHPWQLVLQPNAQVMVMGEPPFSLLTELSAMADLEEVQERTLAYRLTRQSIYRAFRGGWSLSHIREFFAQHSSAAMPQNLQRTLEEWWDQYQRILLRRDRLVIHAQDKALIETLLKSPLVAKEAYRPREDILVLPARLEQRVKHLLETMNHPPIISASAEEERRGALRLEGDSLVSTMDFPGLYVEATVGRFAERREKGWQLTEQSIHAAVESGLSTESILADLQELLNEPLPTEWEQRIKRWGKHYGTVQVSKVYLLRFASSKHLEEALADAPNLRRHLRPITGREEALAIVNVKGWPKVKETLEALGVAFEMQD